MILFLHICAFVCKTMLKIQNQPKIAMLHLCLSPLHQESESPKLGHGL